ncbi:hypothetical protein GA0115252_138116 [Streptomyces sp. DfronAA-171]|nr:hypothetical protein GA0115252_138116 [Streptomyces sp. DfronAA-171]
MGARHAKGGEPRGVRPGEPRLGALPTTSVRNRTKPSPPRQPTPHHWPEPTPTVRAAQVYAVPPPVIWSPWPRDRRAEPCRAHYVSRPPGVPRERTAFLYVVVRAAGDSHKLISAARGRGGGVGVVATPQGLGFLGTGAVEARTGHPIRSAWRRPGEARPPTPSPWPRPPSTPSTSGRRELLDVSITGPGGRRGPAVQRARRRPFGGTPLPGASEEHPTRPLGGTPPPLPGGTPRPAGSAARPSRRGSRNEAASGPAEAGPDAAVRFGESPSRPPGGRPCGTRTHNQWIKSL